MIRVEFAKQEVTEKKGKAKASGNDYVIRRQEGYLHNGHTYPDRFEANVPDDLEKGYSPGFYTITPGSVVVNGDFKQLEFSRFDTRFQRLPESEQGQYAKSAAAAKA